MKKMFLSAAAFAVVAVSAIAVAPTTSEAIPAFARQTGAACLSCHFQAFPALTSFGRSFKLNAFTDVGEEALIEDDRLSLPSVLNLAFMARADITKTKTNAVTTTAYNIPVDAVLFVAGRVGSHTGAFVEFNPNGAGAGAPNATNWQLMNSFDFGTYKAGINIANAGWGMTSPLEVSAVYGQHAGKLNGSFLDATDQFWGAMQATSVTGWAANDMFIGQIGGTTFVNAGAAGAVSARLMPYVRLNGIFDLGGTEALIGLSWVNGIQSTGQGATIPQGVDGMSIDAQFQGDMGDISYGIYADYVTTRAKSSNGGAKTNLFAGGVDAKKDGYSIRADIKPIQWFLVGVGYGYDKTKPAVVATGAVKNTRWQVALTYQFYQNLELNAHYNNLKNTTGGVATTTKESFVELQGLF